MGRQLLLNLIITVICSLCMGQFSFADEDRETKDLKAKESFLKLHFFADGRGMHMVPGLAPVYESFMKQPLGFKFTEHLFKARWGLNIVGKEPIGLFTVPYKDMKVGVLGCVACHSAKAAGVFIPGLGNKNVDVLQIGKDAKLVEGLYSKLGFIKPNNPDYKEVERSALEFADLLSKQEIGNYTQGLVPVSFIRTWFYRQAGVSFPKDMTPGVVKVPSLWGYGVKRKVGQFSDGFGVGSLPGWAIAVELTGGQTVETVRSYIPKIEAAEDLLGDFLPPKYPFSVHQEAAQKGEVVFRNNCMECHGSYTRDDKGLPNYEVPKWIPYFMVQTDFDRIKANTEEFYKLVEQNPLRDIIQANRFGAGYFAPRLVGVWSRFPYLHNGSVPNVWELLKKPADRIPFFSLRNAGEKERFSETQMGLTLPVAGSAEYRSQFNKAKRGDRDIYWINRIGQSNQGHEFGTDLNEDQKLQLIEYLKTL